MTKYPIDPFNYQLKVTAWTTISMLVGSHHCAGNREPHPRSGHALRQSKPIRSPQPADQWTEARDNTDQASISPQLPSWLESVMGPLTKCHSLSEDCPHLTSIAPEDATDTRVMVWLRGGLTSQAVEILTATKRSI
ncbi:uncharacterized protein N7477_002401 [Penicillium maclennaniae]|uniref:uncharacterized protein n=1 Tax=Penicillium maclennaniae TaxID=1343394 RepID=UPI00253F6F70|nr:uncharacterized protein N7477_002401 [Penicillium maclennaniae]KAJ5676768.1 hypothetical protein N7477_002401 [Penicillium maclennaniae]